MGTATGAERRAPLLAPPVGAAVAALLAFVLATVCFASASVAAASVQAGGRVADPGARVAAAPPQLDQISPSFRCRGSGRNTAAASAGLSALQGSAVPFGTGARAGLRVSLSGPVSFKLALALAGKVSCSATKEVAVRLGSGLTFEIGPRFTFASTGPAKGSFSWTPKLTFDFTLGGRGFSHTIHAMSGKAPPVSLSGSGEVTLSLQLAIAIRQADGRRVRTGVSGTFGPTLSASVRSDAAGSCWNASYDARGRVGAHPGAWPWLAHARVLSTGTYGRQVLPVACAGQIVSVANPGDQVSSIGSAVSLQLSASDLAGGQLTYSSTGLPAGLSLDPSSGLITGTPTAASSSEVHVSVTDTAHVVGTTTFAWTTEPPPGPSTAASSVSAGLSHACAVLTSHWVDCWGANPEGGLGDNSTVASSLPVEVSGLTNATAVSAGADYTCALLEDGQIDCWGDNAAGELGAATTDSSSLAPVQVAGITGATQLAAGDYHACTVLGGGDVDCWGSGQDGDLGDGNTAVSSAPTQVSGIDDATQAAVGFAHSCALLSTGAAECWGSNTAGQLGAGQPGNGQSSDYVTSPQQVQGLTTATQIAAGGAETCVLLNGGQVDCWGSNGNGGLGSGTTGGSSDAPAPVSAITNATQIAVSDSHACALLATGQVQCWGQNSQGELGDGGTDDSNVPVTVSGITNAVQVTTGDDSSCAVLDGGAIDCWGADSAGDLGDGTTAQSDVPVEVTGIS
ncbi:MAG: putative Ig domain-containing protein [Solirubrobacteraceae bacterium]